MMEAHLSGSDKFLVEVLVKPGNRIYVFIDGDHGVTIDDCVKASRFLESGLDREQEDFELNVSSAGADHPIMMPRQYLKNIGRQLRILQKDGQELKGKLLATDEKGITLEIKGDKKVKTPTAPAFIEYENIQDAKVILSFK
ncbi:MAG: ribosome assembly cofactor RimP [Bacteroidales bacterium]|nr:ribosome assembly cofactor RimP [Bacteroidales bacterium]